MNEHQRRLADRTANTAGETIQNGNAALKQSARDLEQGYFAISEAIRDFNVSLIEMAHANTMATLEPITSSKAGGLIGNRQGGFKGCLDD